MFPRKCANSENSSECSHEFYLPSPLLPRSLRTPVTSLPSQHHLHATCLWFTSSCFKAKFTCMFLYRDSLRPHYQTKVQALLLACSDGTCRYFHLLWEKKRTRAIYKVINNLFFLYINPYEDNITYVCDSNFLYRILLIFNMALKGTVT